MLAAQSFPVSFAPAVRGVSAGSCRGCDVRVLSIAAVVAVAVLSPAHDAGADEAAKTARPDAAADQTGPLDLVKVSVARVLAIVQAQPAGVPLTGKRRVEIRRVAEDLFDFDEMARRTLAQHWKDRSPQEQAEFVQVFVEVLERSYLTTISNYSVAAVTFQGESVGGSYAQVRSRIITDKRVEIPIEYRLLLSDRWQVYDVVAAGVSLISSYRSQFNSIIRTSSFAQLLERLRNREALVVPRESP
jgi:phospholipid transport system substrate-binding protein